VNRRGFLGAILAAAAAPAIVRADSLMRVIPVDTEVLTFSSAEILIDQSAPSSAVVREQVRIALTEWWGRTADGVICRALVDEKAHVLLFEETPLKKMPAVVPGWLPDEKEGDTIRIKLP
jgi:hypothetical protein